MTEKKLICPIADISGNTLYNGDYLAGDEGTLIKLEFNYDYAQWDLLYWKNKMHFNKNIKTYEPVFARIDYFENAIEKKSDNDYRFIYQAIGCGVAYFKDAKKEWCWTPDTGYCNVCGEWNSYMECCDNCGEPVCEKCYNERNGVCEKCIVIIVTRKKGKHKFYFDSDIESRAFIDMMLKEYQRVYSERSPINV